MDSLAAQILIDILTEEMCLDPQRIWIEDQNKKIPTDLGLFLTVGNVGTPTVICNKCYMQTETVNNVEVQHQVSYLQTREDFQIDIMSRSNEAIQRHPEITMALQSFYAQQQMEANFFKIFRMTHTDKTSGAEGGSNINRFTITASCFVWYIKDKVLNSPLGDYYNDFTQRVDDETTIGTDTPLIEFEITPDTPPPP